MTYVPKDFSIMLHYYTEKTRPMGPQWNGPGWYLRSCDNEGYRDYVRHVKIDPEQAVEIAKDIDAVLGTGGMLQSAVDRLNRSLADELESLEKRLETTVKQLEQVRDDRRKILRVIES